ncbi:MAG: hypothetical protein IT178_06135 [Acidobacteria bacterium]|nr:hypothetical protein [Acidobacteriota bacterium]
MPPLRHLRVLAVCLITGAAIYVSRGVLDATIVEGRTVRIALLPPWETLASLLAAVLVGLLLLHRLAVSRRGPAPPLERLLTPLLGLGILLLPFLPWLADVWPPIQIAAGPAGLVVWLGVAMMLLWTLRQEGVLRLPTIAITSTTTLSLLVALGVAAISAVPALRLTGTPLVPAGDEPHYLVIAQSLWRDGDLKIENNHQRGDYREYFNRDLDPHYLTRGADGEIYSIHPVGLPVLLTPIYGLGGYRAVVVTLIAVAAAAAALAWRWVVAVLADRVAATFAVAAIAGSAPFMLNTFMVYPEIAAALAVMIALVTPNHIVAGIACGMLPWLSTKYAPMSAVLLVTGLIGPAASPFRWPGWTSIVKRGVPYAVFLTAWFAFFYIFWGKPLPQAPYGAMVQTTPKNLVFGAPGLLFDQEYGLLAYAPVYILAATGLWAMWKAAGEQRLLAIRIVLVFGALLGTVGAFRIWWGGSAAPARPLASGLLVLALPIAAAFAAAPRGSARRAAQHLLLWIGVAIAATVVFAQEGLLMAQGRDGTSALLEWWSPRWEIWALAPSFIHHEAPTAWVFSLTWLAIASVAAFALRRVPRVTAGTAALTAVGAITLALAAVSVIVPLLPDDPPFPRANLAARSRLAALDGFDPRALPAAVIYDPLRKVSAADVLPLFHVGVQPGLRPEPQPLRVLHNGRFTLPAGDYRIDLTFVPGQPKHDDTVGFQMGRVGMPLETWPVSAGQGAMSRTVHLPLDASFVGLRGSREVEEALATAIITPLTVTPAGERQRTPTVLGAGRYGPLEIYLHDDLVNLERAGFWIPGQRPTTVSLGHTPGATGPFVLRLRSRVDDNVVTVKARGWEQSITLMAEQPQDLVLPAPARGVETVVVTTSNGFRPIERDPENRDRRFLGVWVEGLIADSQPE